jgi:leader peptidase (prepilin peptidase)/N-methyltransferase
MVVMDLLLYLVVLFYSSITDLKYKIIKNRVHVIIIILGVIHSQGLANLLTLFVGSLVITIPFLVIAIKTNKFGGGDVKFIFANGIYLGFWNNYIGILLGLSLVIINHVLLRIRHKGNKERQIPLAPFLSAGYFIVSISKRLLIS